MPAAPGGEETDVLFAQRHEVPIRLFHVAEGVLAQHLDDSLRRRIGIEHQVRLGLGLGVVAEGVVQQVVEHLAVQVGLAAIVGGEGLQGRPPRRLHVAHPQSQLPQLVVILGQQVRLQVEHDLQEVLDAAEEGVVVFQQGPLLVGQAADVFQLGHGLEGVGGAQRGQVAAVEQLQELDDEFHVADAAPAGLHVAVVAAALAVLLLDAPLQGLDAADVGTAEVAAVDPGGQLGEELAAEVQVAGHRQGLDVGLPLPGAAADVVIVQRRLQVGDRRPALSLGPQPQVHAVDAPQIGRLGQQADQLAGEVVEKLGVGDGPVAVGLAVEIIEEDQVDVAGVVQLAAAELAHAQDDEPRGASVGAAGRAPLGAEFPPGGPQRRFQNGVGQVGDLGGDGLEALLADDVAVGDPQRLPPLESPQRGQHHLIVVQGLDLGHQVLDEDLPRHRRPFGQPQEVETFRVAGQQIAEVLAGGKNLHQRRQRRRDRARRACPSPAGCGRRSRNGRDCSGPCPRRRSGPGPGPVDRR